MSACYNGTKFKVVYVKTTDIYILIQTLQIAFYTVIGFYDLFCFLNDLTLICTSVMNIQLISHFYTHNNVSDVLSSCVNLQ